MEKQRTQGNARRLIALCWLVYTCSYVGKLSYSANINPLREAFGVRYDEAGAVATFFFFAYGIGQVVNGLLCRRYKLRGMIFCSLLLGSAMNLLVAVTPDFALLKYYWLINGMAMSFLWPSLVRLLSETLPQRSLTGAVVAMGTTVAAGTVVVYGLSAALTALGAFRVTFYVAAVVLLAVAAVWLVAYRPLTAPLLAEREDDRPSEEQGANADAETASTAAGSAIRGGLALSLGTFAIFAVVNNFVKDGLTAWTPDILDAQYGTPGWLSILLTLLLPTLAIFGTVVAVRMSQRVSDPVSLCGVLFLLSSVMVGGVLGLLTAGGSGALTVGVTVAFLALISCFMAGVNNVITSMVPLQLRSDPRVKGNSGSLAGILNGCCYVGSTASAYGLGLVAERAGWLAVFWVLLGACALTLLLSVVYLLLRRRA